MQLRRPPGGRRSRIIAFAEVGGDIRRFRAGSAERSGERVRPGWAYAPSISPRSDSRGVRRSRGSNREITGELGEQRHREQGPAPGVPELIAVSAHDPRRPLDVCLPLPSIAPGAMKRIAALKPCAIEHRRGFCHAIDDANLVAGPAEFAADAGKIHPERGCRSSEVPRPVDSRQFQELRRGEGAARHDHFVSRGHLPCRAGCGRLRRIGAIESAFALPRYSTPVARLSSSKIALVASAWSAVPRADPGWHATTSSTRSRAPRR